MSSKLTPSGIAVGAEAPKSPRVEWLVSAPTLEWDAFVQAHPQGTIYYTNGWLVALAESFPQMTAQIAVVRDSVTRAIRSGIPFCLVKSWLLNNRLNSLPLAPTCTPLLGQAGDWAIILDGIQCQMRQLQIRSVEIKCTQIESNPPRDDWCVINQFKYHSIDLKPGWYTIQSTISKSGRRMVDKARQAKVSVEIMDYSGNWPVLHQLFEANRRRLGLPIIPRAFFNALNKHLSSEALYLLVARQEAKPVGALLCLGYKYCLSAEFIGEADMDGPRTLGINQLLYWEAIRIACEKGFSCFSFGRTANDNTGLIEFKRRWGTIEEDAPILIFPGKNSNGKAQGLNGAAMVRGFFRHSPMWLYRRASAFCYRHWG